MSGRTVHAIRVQLQGMADRPVIIWVKSDKKHCITLMNPRRTWLTARRGDAVIFKHNGSQGREHIDAIELYRVFPAFLDGREVESARTWIEGNQNA